MLTATMAAWATDYAVVDGIRYEIVTYMSPQPAYVVAPESGVYTGAVTIPATINYEGNDYAVTQISSGAFENSTITSLTLPVGLQYIFSSFTGTSLTSLTIPGTVSYLSSMGECTSLTSITFAYDGIDGITDEFYWSYGQGAMRLGDYCFDYCTNLTEIIVDRPLYYGSNYTIFKKATKATFGPHATSIPAHCFEGVTLEQLTIGANVTEIGSYAFRQATLPAGYAFPFSQIKNIGWEAFYECKNLPAAIDLSSTEEIGNQAFTFCTDIQSLTIGDCNLASGAFLYCTNLSSLTLAEGLTDTGDSNFQYLDGLTTVTFPSTLKRIGWGAFQNCPNLTIPDGLPAGLEEISGQAFYQCAKVNVTLPSSLKIIDQYAFSNTGMESVTIPTSLTDLGDQAFSYCEKLKTVSIPYAETPINLSYTFWNCTNVESITIDRSFTIPESTTAFSGSVDKTEVVIGPHVTTLPPYAFYYASFKSVTLSVNLASIGKFAFLGTTVPSLTLPNACTEIAYRAFDGSYIDNLYVPYLTPIALPTEDIEQLFYYSGTKLWVPGGTMALYQAADGWKLFENMDYWSFVVNADVAGKGTLAVKNGEAVTDNGTNTEKTVKGEKLVAEGAGEAVSGLFVREKDLTLTSTPARGYELTGLKVNAATQEATNGNASSTYAIENLLADQTINATFTPIIYKLTYNLAGGALPAGQTNPATFTVESETFTLVNPERTGYEFMGWTGADLSEPTMEVTIEKGSIDDREYTATWKPIPYKVRFNSLATAAEPYDQDFVYDTEQALTANAFTRTGYAFVEWTANADGTGTKYADKAVVKNLTTVKNDVVNLYAQWAPITYYVAFNANNGTGEMNNQLFTYDVEQALTANAFTRTGYLFDGWNSKADGSGTPYADKAAVKNLSATQDDVVTIYAQWKPITYYVAFNAKGGTGEMSNQQFTYDVEQALTENAFARKGYNFYGWNTQEDLNGITYADGADVKNLSTVHNSVVNVYAVWNPITYNITYDLAGGALADGVTNPVTYTIESDAITLVNPTRKGYEFVGWTGTELTEATKNVTIAKGSTENRTYTASWTPITYTITYDLAGGVLAEGVTNPTAFTIESETFTLVNPTREYYDFAGWTGTGLGAATQNVTITQGSTENRTYTATWEIKKTAITLAHEVATFSFPYALDFTGTGLKAYVASSFENGLVTMAEVEVVPANTGVMIVGDVDTEYMVPYTASATAPEANLLKPVSEAMVIPTTEGEYTNFLYSEKNDQKGFYKSSGTGYVTSGKAYLQLPTAALTAGIKIIGIAFDEAAGLQHLEAGIKAAGVYDMTGRKVGDTFETKNLPQGIYIVNGKKVTIK